MLVLRASCAPRVYHESEFTTFGAPLADGGYFTVTTGGDSENHHWVEIDDQSFGKGDGIASFQVAPDARSIAITLTFDFQQAGRELVLQCEEPMDSASTQWARAFSLEIAERR